MWSSPGARCGRPPRGSDVVVPRGQVWPFSGVRCGGLWGTECSWTLCHVGPPICLVCVSRCIQAHGHHCLGTWLSEQQALGTQGTRDPPLSWSLSIPHTHVQEPGSSDRRSRAVGAEGAL